jgi:hypothetical protein
MKKLYKFNWNCGRQGDLDGVFIRDDADVAAALGKFVDFGSALGKHSEITGTLEEADFEVASEDQAFIAEAERILGTSLSGYNPFDYLDNCDAEQEE